MAEEISKDMIRGHVNAIVLNILSQGDSYGYAIAKMVRQLSEERYELNEATLYTVFRRLEKAGDIQAYWGDESQGGRRKYYKITEQGTQTLQGAQSAWRFAQQVIDELINGKIGDESWKNY